MSGYAALMFAFLWSSVAIAADRIEGRVLGGGAPIAGSSVTLWEAGSGEPRRVATAHSSDDGRFEFGAADTNADASLYIVASGGTPAGHPENPAIRFLAVLGARPPASVTLNEMTTLASVITHAQFLDGQQVKGNALALKIAAGNTPNFVDFATGGYGAILQDALNSSQTPTMANLSTLSSLLAGCTTQATTDACARLFAAASPPAGPALTDTLGAAEAIIRNPAHNADKFFTLLNAF
jgi:hypothetical protein